MNTSTLKEIPLKTKIGQLFLVGYKAGQEGLEEFSKRLQTRPYGNVILFSRNEQEPEQLREHNKKLSTEIEKSCGISPLIAADQEGGTVLRLKSGYTAIPGMMAIASAFKGGKISLEDVERLAELSGRELLYVGVNWNLAPVLDVNSNKDNPVIGVRSFGDDPEFVATLSSAYIRGLQRAGILATAKHFPGYGDVNIDPHLGLPIVKASLDRIEKVEMIPFKEAIKNNVSSIMTAHMLFPAIESKAIPITLSNGALTNLLRKKMSYDGIVVTDCLEMKAIDGVYPDAAVKAISAGADVLCISHTAEKQDEAFDSILNAVETGRIPIDVIDCAVNRVLKAKESMKKYQNDLLQTKNYKYSIFSEQSLNIAKKISENSICITSKEKNITIENKSILVDILPKNLCAVEDNKVIDFTLSGILKNAGLGIDSVIIKNSISNEQIDSICEQINNKNLIIALNALSKDSEMYQSIKKLVSYCEDKSNNIIFILMRAPYETETLSKIGKYEHPVICAYEYSSLSAHSVAKVLCGQISINGKCPVNIN